MRNYKAKIKKIHKNNIRERKLSKALSKSVMINLCPYCEFHYKLVSRGYETHKIDDMKIADTCKVQCIEGYKYCKLKSSALENVWVRVTDDRPKVIAGKTYGKITPLYIKYKDNYGNMYWDCLIDDNGNKKIIRSQEILRGNAIYRVRKREYKRGSSHNPDGMIHVYPMEHSSKVGMAVETLIQEEKDVNGEKIIIKYYKKSICEDEECGGTIRYNALSEGQCEVCGLIA